MRIEEREQGLINLVTAYRDQSCRRLLDEAQGEARDLIRRTYGRERAHLHAQIVAERQRARSRIEAALADRDTRERRRGERATARLLEAAWPRLQTALVARWQSPGGRRQWAERALELARQSFPAGDRDGRWMIQHAPEWVDDERRELIVAMALGLSYQPRCYSDGQMVAGLKITGQGAVLDASLAGLLQDRRRLEARLLALLAADSGAPPVAKRTTR
ncbi:hypothetical protein ABC977_13535 [Thioalkalicoccus limnaeus]|uniref:V-type ATP synthase subunit E n=1 Tax=Thioalkalicoccus limnaeus TaxID=120681 RepID=A0ABV4BGT7_9GAMM